MQLSSLLFFTFLWSCLFLLAASQGTPPTFVFEPEDTFIEKGSTEYILCQVVGDPTPAVRWLSSSNDILSESQPGDGYAYLFIPDAQGSDYYTCQAYNSNGDIDKTITVTAVDSTDTGPKVTPVPPGPVTTKRAPSITTRPPSTGTPPKFVFDPQDTFLDRGSSEYILCSADGDPVPEVRWLSSSNDILSQSQAGDGNAYLFIPDAQGSDYYTCQAYNANGDIDKTIRVTAVDSTDAGPKVTPVPPGPVTTKRAPSITTRPPSTGTPPKFVFDPQDTFLDRGSSEYILCSADGDPVPEVRWLSSSNDILSQSQAGDGNAYLFIPDAQGSDYYTCQAYNANGDIDKTIRVTAVDSTDAGPKVTPVPPGPVTTKRAPSITTRPPSTGTPPKFVFDPQDTFLDRGSSEYILCSADGDPVPEVRWLSSSNDILSQSQAGDGNAYLFIPDAQGSDYYTCQAYNANGDIDKTITVTAVDSTDAGPKVIPVPPGPVTTKRAPSITTRPPSTGTPPKFVFDPQDTFLDRGSSEYILCSADGDPVPEVRWLSSSNDILSQSQAGDGNAYLFIPDAQISDYYTCQAYNANGDIDKTITVTAVDSTDAGPKVTPVPPGPVTTKRAPSITTRPPSTGTPPKFVFDPQDTFLDRGSSEYILCSADGDPVPEVRWLSSSNDILSQSQAGDGNAYLFIPDAQISDYYTCQAYNANGDIDKTITVTAVDSTDAGPKVTPVPPGPVTTKRAPSITTRPPSTGTPPKFVFDPQDTFLDRGSSEYILCSADGDPVPEVRWLSSSNDILSQSQAGDGNAYLFIPDAQGSDYYTCQAYNANGDIDKTITVTAVDSTDAGPKVTPVPPGPVTTKRAPSITTRPPSTGTPPKFVFDPQDTFLDRGSSEYILCSADGDPVPEVRWLSSSNDILSQSQAGDGNAYLFIPDAQGSDYYTCQAYNANGDIDKTITVTAVDSTDAGPKVTPVPPGPVTTKRAPSITTRPSSTGTPPKFVFDPQDTFLDRGSSEYILCSADGDPVPEVRWLSSSNDILSQSQPGDGYAYLFIPDVQGSDSYTCQAYNSAGTVDKTIRVTAKDPGGGPRTSVPPLITSRTPIIATRPPSTECDFCSGAPYLPVCGTDGISYYNECELRRYACYTNDVTLAVSYEGQCREVIPTPTPVVNPGTGTPPNFIFEPENAVLDIGSSEYILCSADGEPVPEVRWLSSSNDILSQSQAGDGYAYLFIPDVQGSDYYTCQAYNSAGDVDKTITVTAKDEGGGPRTTPAPPKTTTPLTTTRVPPVVTDPPTGPGIPPYFAFEPQDKVLERGGTDYILCSGSGEPIPDVRWLSSTDEILVQSVPGDGYAWLYISDIKDTDSYTCHVYNPHGQIFRSVTVSVDDGGIGPKTSTAPVDKTTPKITTTSPPSTTSGPTTPPSLTDPPTGTSPYFAFEPQDKNLEKGGNEFILCSAGGDPTPDIRWLSSSDEVLFQSRPGEGYAYLSIYDAKETDSYTCHAYNAFGQVFRSITVTVDDGGSGPKTSPIPPETTTPIRTSLPTTPVTTAFSSAGPTPPRTTNPPTGPFCEPISSENAAHCPKLPYTMTTFPSVLGHRHQEDVSLALTGYIEYLALCPKMQKFMCSIHLLPCQIIDHQQFKVLPCASFCEEAAQQCPGAALDCRQFPSSEGFYPKCWDGNDEFSSFPDRADTKTCFPSTHPICSPLAQHTYLPNVFGHIDVRAAERASYYFLPILRSNCIDSRHLTPFICAAFLPSAGQTCEEGREPPLPLCREVCKATRDEAAACLEEQGLSWPPIADCDAFPPADHDQCMFLETTPRTDPPGETKCVQSTHPICSQFATNTYLPNVFGHIEVVDADLSTYPFLPIVQSGCGPQGQLILFVCEAFLPDGGSCDESVGAPLPLCREVCESLRIATEVCLYEKDLRWPTTVDCDLFPPASEGNCVHLRPVFDRPVVTLSPYENDTWEGAINVTQPYQRPTADYSEGIPLAEERVCEPLAEQYAELCPNITYTTTTYPNFFGHRSQEEAAGELQTLLQVLFFDDSCPFKDSMCVIHFPPCKDINNTALIVPPCRSGCEEIADQCPEDVMDCSLLPNNDGSYAKCWDINDNSIFEDDGDSEVDETCEEVPSEFCRSLGFTHTRFPNALKHQDAQEALQAFEDTSIQWLINYECSEELASYSCAVIFPSCDEEPLPCEEVCRQHWRNCRTAAESLILEKNEIFRCNKYYPSEETGETCVTEVTAPRPIADTSENCYPSEHLFCNATNVYLPNIFNHTDPQIAELASYEFLGMLQPGPGCPTDNLMAFVCASYFPDGGSCDKSDNETEQPLPPCREACIAVQEEIAGCIWVTSGNLLWPYIAACDRFPSAIDGECLDLGLDFDLPTDIPDEDYCEFEEILPRRYDLSYLGDGCYFRGWADVSGQGASNDYCRIVADGKEEYLSCALAGTEGDSEFNYNSANASDVWIDIGYKDTWYMKDEDDDGKDDYCRCVGKLPDTYVSCMKAGDEGFLGIYDFTPSLAQPNCEDTKIDPYIGAPLPPP